MSFPDYMNSAGLGASVKSGFQALGSHSRSVRTKHRNVSVTGSIDLDSALSAAEPQAARWDYGIGVRTQKGEQLEWVEVHPASSGEVKVVLAKLDWLKEKIDGWPQANGHGVSQHRFHWVPTGSVRVDEKRRRQMNSKGITLSSAPLSLPSS